MKKFVFILYLLLLQIGFAYTQVYFNNNTLDEKSSAIGENNNNQGINSLTVGTNNFVNRGLQNIVLFGEDNLAKYNGLGRSAAFGFNNTVMADYSIAIGRENVASAVGSISIGTANTTSGLFSFSLGNFCQSEKKFAYTIGTRVRSSAEGAITIGNAPQNHILNNDNLYSLMVGFNSDLPTFFVRYSNGLSTTGRIGIGNVTSPTAKLHIRADDYENAIVRIENTESDKLAGIVFGDSTQSIITGQEMPFTFNSGQNDFYFKNGRVGIGRDTPEANLHIYSAFGCRLRLENYYGEVNHKTWDVYNDDGKLNFQYGSGENPYMTTKMMITHTGNIGIGTSEPPTEKLEVAGNIMATQYFGDGSELSGIEGDNLGNHVLSQTLSTSGNWINFNNNPGQGIYIDSIGKIGIGTAIPVSKFDVAGDITALAYHGDGSALSGTGDDLGNHILQQKLITTGHWINSDTDDNQGIFIGGGGEVGICTTDFGTNGIYKLAVAGAIRAEEVQIEHIDKWYDCVFEDDYTLTPLKEVETFVKQNKHLPEVPSEAEVMENGISVGQMNAILLKKVEELTLHLIEQEKKIEDLQKALRQ